jgi:hypothetical protein
MPGSALRFDVLRNNSRIGQHAIRFERDGDTLIATIEVKIAVGFGPVTLFRYAHKAREVWAGGRFISLESETDENGKPFRVTAARTADDVIVRSAVGRQMVLAPDAIPLTHWNSLCVERPLFNPQDGQPMPAKVVVHGEELVLLSDRQQVRATRYSLMLKPVLDDWYDSSGVWTALRTRGSDGSIITYRRHGG